MAKAITSKLLQSRKLKHPVEIRAAGAGPLTHPEISYAARYVINEMYNEDVLKNDKPELLTQELVRRADLILVMDQGLLESHKFLPKDKTYVLKEFFGKSGKVEDPYPDGRDALTLSRYRDCATELRQLLSEGLDRLISVLDL